MSASGIYIPASGYNTGYYSVLDSSCVGSGPIASDDDAINKLLAGGIYFDIDRSKLGAKENLILHLTMFSLGNGVQAPDNQLLTANDNPIFKVHLMSIGQNTATLQGVNQPRYFSYSDNNLFPGIAKSISIVAPGPGQLQEEQIVVPLSIDPTIDRIRIERYSGSAILIDASLFRLSQH